LSVAKKLSVIGTTEPRYLRTSSGCSRIASEIEPKITPALASSSLKVVTTETESKTASTATRDGVDPSSRTTPASISCSRSGMPSFSYVLRISGSISSSDFGPSFFFGAE
jgi:hypothetical protein